MCTPLCSQPLIPSPSALGKFAVAVAVVALQPPPAATDVPTAAREAGVGCAVR